MGKGAFGAVVGFRGRTQPATPAGRHFGVDF